MNWSLDNLITVAGYECPKDANPQTKRVLRKLSASKSGVLAFTHDDGPSAVTRNQLVEIAGFIGLHCFEEPYRIILLDEEDNMARRFDGVQDVRESDYTP